MKLRVIALCAALAALCACSNGADSPTIAASGGSSAPATAPAGPRRIVSMSATATEMLFAIGAGSQVVAADNASDFPADAPKTKLSAFEPNAEAIARYRPDLVVLSDDIKGIKKQLTTLHIPVVLEPAAKTLDDSYRQLADLGTRTGHADAAATVVSSMKSRINDLTAGLPTRAKPLTYFYELDNTLYTVTSAKTFIGQLFTLAGLTSIADPADKTGGGYPQLSAEYLVRADPDFVFLADTKCCKQTASTFAARPGFAHLKAVRDAHVVALDDDVASRWGPRVVDLLKTVVDAVKAAPAR